MFDHARAKLLEQLKVIRGVSDLLVLDAEGLQVGHDVLDVLILSEHERKTARGNVKTASMRRYEVN